MKPTLIKLSAVVAFTLATGFLAVTTASAQNVVSNPGFEAGTTGWTARSGGTLQSVTGGHSGSKAVRLYNRTSTAHGIQQSLPVNGLPDDTLCLGLAWVKTSSATPVSVSMEYVRVDGKGTSYSSIVTAQVSNNWTLLRSPFSYDSSGTVTSLQLYIEGPPSGVDLFVDDVSCGKIVPAAPENILANPGFESGLTGWSARAGATISSTTSSHSGTNCAVATRTAAWQGVQQSLLGKMQAGRTYFISGWARTDSAATETVKLTMELAESGSSSYTNLATEQVMSNCWVYLSGYYTPQPTGTMSGLNFYVEGPAAGVKLYFDDAYVAPVTALRKAAASFPGMRLSTIMGTSIWPTNEQFAAACAGNFHMMGTENDTKFAGLETANNLFKYAKANATLDFSQAHGGVGRGHCQVWHGDSVPTWVTGVSRTPAEMKSILWNHIDTTTSYYRDRLPCWDVVNEAFNSDGTIRATGTGGNTQLMYWYDNPGIGYAGQGSVYIAEAFKRARMADPDSKLIYNDFSTNNVNAKSNGIYNMLSGFVSSGVPVDGVGFQSHLGLGALNIADLYSNMLRFQNLGLDIHITELDVKCPINASGIATAADLETQGEVYFDLLGTSLGLSRMKIFQIWGIYDGSTWIVDQTSGAYGQPLLFDFNFDKKPAFWGCWNALAGQAEKLEVVDISAGNSTALVSGSPMSAAAGLRLAATAGNQFMTLQKEVPFKGQWNVKVGVLKTGSSGKFQLAVAGPGSGSFANVGSVTDTYSATSAAAEINLGTVDVGAAGDCQFRFTVPSKNASSTGYGVTIDYIRLSPVACDPAFTQPVSGQFVPVSGTLAPILFMAEDDTAAGSLVVTAASSNPALVPDNNLIIEGASPYYTLAVTPLANQTGSTDVTLTASDGTRTTTQTFTLTVASQNTTPTISPLADLSTNENTATAAIPFTIGDGETAATSLTVTGNSSNTALVPNASIVFSGTGANRTLAITPAANQSGTTTIAVTVSDGVRQATTSFELVVTAANKVPAISGIVDQVLPLNASTGALGFTVSDLESAASSLEVTGSSSDTALVPTSGIVFGGAAGNRTVTVTPAPMQTGSCTITLTVSDGAMAASIAFQMTVDPLALGSFAFLFNQDGNFEGWTNSAKIANVAVSAGLLSGTITGGDPQLLRTGLNFPGNNVQTVLVRMRSSAGGTAQFFWSNEASGISAANSMTATVPSGADFQWLALNVSSSSNWAGHTIKSLRFDPPGSSGTVEIDAIIGTDGDFDNDGLSDLLEVGTQLDPTVFTVESAPTITSLADLSTNEDTPTAPISFTVGDAETAAASLAMTGTSSNTTLVPVANVVLGGSGANRTVAVTPALNQTGTSSITLTVSDGVLSASKSFVLTVAPVNDAPTISAIGNVSTSVGTATAALPFTVGDIDSAFSALTLSGSSSNPALLADANIVFGGSNANRTVTVTTTANQLGTSVITVTISDGFLRADATFLFTVTGTPQETWRFAQFGSTTNLGSGADTANPDGDAWNNAQEYVLGGNPVARDSSNPLASTPGGSSITLSFFALAAEGTGYAGLSRIYDLETTSNLADPLSWKAVTGYTGIIGANQTVSVTQPLSGTANFYRLKVRLQ